MLEEKKICTLCVNEAYSAMERHHGHPHIANLLNLQNQLITKSLGYLFYVVK